MSEIVYVRIPVCGSCRSMLGHVLMKVVTDQCLTEKSAWTCPNESCAMFHNYQRKPEWVEIRDTGDGLLRRPQNPAASPSSP